jgi:hypothetical protein
MSERRPIPASVPQDPLAQWNDHLARVLAQADRLLREWQTHADAIRKEGLAAGEIVHKALEDALADVSATAATQLDRALSAHAGTLTAKLAEAQRMARELESHLKKARGGGTAGSERARLTLILAASANVLAVIAIAVLLLRAPAAPAPLAAAVPDARPAIVANSAPVDAGIVVSMRPDAGPAPVASPRGPCEDLPIPTPPHAARLVQECANRACAPATPVKTDGDIRPNGALVKLLESCKPSEASGRDLIAAMRVMAEGKGFYKLACPLPQRSPSGGHTVTVAWLLECPSRR